MGVTTAQSEALYDNLVLPRVSQGHSALQSTLSSEIMLHFVGVNGVIS